MCQDGPAGCYTARAQLCLGLAVGSAFGGALYPMTDEERQLLELIAASDDGCTDVLLLAHGLPIEMIAEAVRAGLAVAHPGRLLAGHVVNTRLLITEAGRRALAGQ
jgi:hypothetical protein